MPSWRYGAGSTGLRLGGKEYIAPSKAERVQEFATPSCSHSITAQQVAREQD